MLLLQCRENFVQRGLVLELAQIRRIGRTDVDHKKIRVRAEDAKRVGIILSGAFQRRNFRFAKIDANGMVRPAAGGAPFGQSRRDGFRARIVEAHAIDECCVGHRAKHPGRGIARLRMPGHSAEFDEAEAQRLPHRDRRRVFVHAGGQADRIGKSQTEQLDRQVGRVVKRCQCLTEHFVPAQPAQGVERAIVNLFGIQREQSRSDQLPIEPTHGGKMSRVERRVSRAELPVG